MFFKLQKAHQVYIGVPEPINGVRIRNLANQHREAELTIAFRYDVASGLFHLYAKRASRGQQPRYDLLTTAKINTVWHVRIEVSKSRRMLSAELTDSKGQQEVVALTYQYPGTVSLETLRPVEEDPQPAVEEARPVPEGTYTLKLWHQYGPYLKKVVAARKIQ